MPFLDWKKDRIFGLKLYFFPRFRSLCDTQTYEQPFKRSKLEVKGKFVQKPVQIEQPEPEINNIENGEKTKDKKRKRKRKNKNKNKLSGV